MGIRTLAICTTASLFMSGVSFAQTNQTPGDTSGPAAGSNINPSTSVQKNRSSSKDATQNNMGSSPAGAPGVEGPAGSENGPAADHNMK